MQILQWTEAVEAGLEECGGKGLNLARLHQYGFPVPLGFVIGAAAYRLMTTQAEVARRIEDLSQATAEEAATSPSVVAALAELQELIVRLPLRAETAVALETALMEADLLDRPVAVRSSAASEDTAKASFAGIHQSFLGVLGLSAVARAIKGCWASLWTPQAVSYRRRLGLEDDAVAAAVVILVMVDAHTAGVGFSCDPKTGRLDRYAISAAVGLGESVVNGAVEPDEYLVDVTDYPVIIARRQIGTKAVKVISLPDGGTVQRPVDPHEAKGPALSDDQIRDLTHLIGRIHDAVGEMAHPQDVEWAYDGRQFWVLQARPVTTLPPPTFPAVADQPIYWSNANLKDVMPGVQSTLGWSFMRSGIDILLAAPLKAGDYPYTGGMTWIRLIDGRAYFNLTAMQWAFYDALAMTPAQFNQVLGGHQPEIAVPLPSFSTQLRRSTSRAKIILRTLSVMKRAPALFDGLWQWAERAEAENLAAISREALLQRFLAVKREMEAFLPRFNLINGAAGASHQELVKTIAPLFGDRATGLVNAAMTGAKNITSAEQGERLVGLANAALHEAAARSCFTDPDWDPTCWQERLAGTRFHADFTAYLRDYGHRGVYEMEPMNPRWKEDPSFLLETVRAQIATGREVTLANQMVTRHAALREVFDRLGLGLKALRFRFFLKQAGRATAQREMAKSVLVKAAGISRYVALEVGRRLAAEGFLGVPSDVFHLSWLDLEAYLRARGGAEGFPALVAARKALRAKWLAVEPPNVITGGQSIRLAPLPTATGPVLTGLGVAAGRARGRARIIHHPHEGSKLQPGEVLVAPSTDPAWTPLFLRASAIIMEVGGSLSHGAIVAREYGLPAVVNIPGLLAAIRDGEYLTVDGSEGKVYREGHDNSGG